MKPIRRHTFTDQERRNAYFETEAALNLAKRALQQLRQAHANHAAARLRATLKSIEGAHRHAARMLPRKESAQ